MNAVSPRCLGTSKSVRVMARPHWEKRAPEVHTFWPLSTHSSPSLTAFVTTDARSDPAAGSLNNWQPYSSWRMIGLTQRCFCSAVP
uniref:Unannotated protein n=1 Tax=freshwater metagenome TaxID=449393 RepID=A0A6J7Q1H5_9ZZZZ